MSPGIKKSFIVGIQTLHYSQNMLHRRNAFFSRFGEKAIVVETATPKHPHPDNASDGMDIVVLSSSRMFSIDGMLTRIYFFGFLSCTSLLQQM